MKKLLRIIFKAVLVLIAVVLILYAGLYAYVSINKKSIINEVTTEIGKKLNGTVSLGDIEMSFLSQFPKFGILMRNVSIRDSLFSQHKHPFFQADKLFIRLSIMKLIKKQPPLNGLTIENGMFYLFTDSAGYTNAYLFEQKKSNDVSPKGQEQKNELELVTLSDVSVTVDDRKKEKLHNYFVNDLTAKLDERGDSSFIFDANADVLIRSMAFNLKRGSFLKEKKFTGDFELVFNKRLRQLQFDSIEIKLSGQPFNLSGRFDLEGDAPQFSLRAHTHNILYSTGKSFLPQRLADSLSKVDLDRPIDINASISGPLKGGDPLVYVDCDARNTQLKTPFLDFDNATFKGYYTNEVVQGRPRDDSNSVIKVNNFTSEWHGLPLVLGSIEILNLYEPSLTCDLSADFPLTKLNELLGGNVLQLKSGDGSVKLTYKGPIERNNNTNSFINGYVTIKDGTLLYAPRDVEMKNVSGQLIFKNSDATVKNLQCQVLNNKILMQGQAKNLLTLINTEPGKATIDWTITTPSLNLGAFVFLLKPGRTLSAGSGNKAKLSDAASKIDEVFEKAVLHVNLDAARLYFKKFEASAVNADVSLLANKYIINNVSMNHAGGSIRMNGSILNQRANFLQAKFGASINDVDVSRLFNAFDHFGQDAITGKNLAGKLTATVGANLGLSEDGNVIPSSVQSNVDFSLKDGALINYEPVKKMQNFIFRNRDFDNIRFAELKDRLDIDKGDIKINRMEIQSTVLSFFVEGIYSMKGNTDISIQVPFSNLKKRDADYNPENVGTDKKRKRSIYLRGRPGSDGNISFKVDLFNRYKKDKEREE